MKTKTTTTIIKEFENIKSVELLSYGTSRKNVFVNNKKVSKEVREKALKALEGDNVKITTNIKTYNSNTCELINDVTKVENGTKDNNKFNKLIAQAILSVHPNAKLINGYEK